LEGKALINEEAGLRDY